MKDKNFEVTKNVCLLWTIDEEKINELFSNREGLSAMIDNLNKLYGTKIKKIIRMHKNLERLGYDIFYKEE